MKVEVLLAKKSGEENKGKIVEELTPKYDEVTRLQG